MNILKPTAFALLITLTIHTPAYALENEEHSHKKHAAEIHLNNGLKWQTDSIFKTSISNIQKKIKQHLKDIHQNSLSAKVYKTLAASLQQDMDTIISTCKLAPEVDEQAHLILVPIAEGINMMGKGEDARAGAVKIIQSLELYPQFFEHPNWKPLRH